MIWLLACTTELTCGPGTIEVEGACLPREADADADADSDSDSDTDTDTDTDTDVSPERELLRLSVGFYGAQRCGDADNWLIAGHELGGVCHLQDGPDLGSDVDLTGGWHDAGDHIKPTLTIAYAAYVLLKAHQAWPAAFDDLDGNGQDDVLDEAEVAIDYLLRVQPDGDLVVMVGGEEDHQVFVTAPFQSTLSPSQGGGVRRVTTGGRADIGGIASAALALAAQTWPERKGELLSAARSAYSTGEARPGGSSADFYEGSDPDANMLCGAAELWVATGEASFLEDALSLHARVGETYWVPTWDNPADFGRHTLVAGGEASVLPAWRKDVERYLLAVETGGDLDGLAFFTDWGSLAASTAAAMSAGLLYEETGEAAFEDFAVGQVDWVAGDNPFGHPFLVGLDGGPENPHHASAYGYDDVHTDWTKAARFQLDGALVGGPKSQAMYGFPAGYEDDVTDWISNEVTLDYNAGLVGAAAFVVTHE